MTRSAAKVGLVQEFVDARPRALEVLRIPSVRVLRGVEEILPVREALVELSNRCGLPGAMDNLEYFLTSLDSLKKIPHLLLFGTRGAEGPWRANDLSAAVLLYEYRVFGFASGMFATADGNGDRTVMAPLADRVEVAALAARWLMERGAIVVLISCQQRYDGMLPPAALQARPAARWLRAMQGREYSRLLQLHDTFDETLQTLGHNTRRNMRRYRHRAERQLAAHFVPDETISLAEFKGMNGASRNPVSEEHVNWRYDMMLKIPGMFVSGLRDGSGEWLSLIGGYRHHQSTEINWQMNRDGLPAYALSTVMRSFLIEHEIELGTRSLLFEGGTPHAMRHSFVTEHAVDLITLRNSVAGKLLRRTAEYLLPEKNFLRNTLSDKGLEWHTW